MKKVVLVAFTALIALGIIYTGDQEEAAQSKGIPLMMDIKPGG